MLFADDSLFFFPIIKDYVMFLKQALQLFCDASGMLISYPKSSMYFSKNAKAEEISMFKQYFDLPLMSNSMVYLGVPMIRGGS